MIKKTCWILALLALGLAISGGCGQALAKGTLNGTIIRESDGQPVVSATVIIGRARSSALVPDQSFFAGKDGKFSITIDGGHYNLQISTKEAGPFYAWPDEIYVAPNETTKVTLILPAGY